MVIENEKPFPDLRYRNNIGLTVIPYGSSFMLLANIDQLIMAEIKALKRGKLKYGVYINNNIPFFLLDLPEIKMTLDSSFNIFKFEQTAVDNWLNNEANAVELITVKAETFIVKAQRLMGIELDCMKQIKEACIEQQKAYTSQKEVDSMIVRICNAVTTDDMIKRSKIYTL
jgi:hypothetical protein